MNGSEPMMFDFSNEDISARGYMTSFDVYTETVHHGDHYGFYLVQSNTEELPSIYRDPTNNKPSSLSAGGEQLTTAALKAKISVHTYFPQDKWFYIKSKASGLVLDVDHGFGREHTKHGANIGLNHQKLYSSSSCHPLLDLQLWRLENGYIVNRRTNLVLDVDDSEFKTGTRIIQWSRNCPEKNANQQWAVSNGFIHPKTYPNLVLDVKDNITCEGARICLGERNEKNILEQRWSFEAVTFSWLSSVTSYTYNADIDEELLQEYHSNHRARNKANQTDCVLQAEPRYHRTIASLMRDIRTMDIALTFGINGGARNVALWAHRSVLEQEPGLAKLLNKLKDIEGPSAGSLADAGVQSYHVTEYPLDAYCALIRFLYSGKIEVQVDLNDFAIGSPPNNPFTLLCKERPVVDGLFSSTASTGSDPLLDTKAVVATPKERSTTFGELFQLADCYEVQDLRGHCRTRIIESMNETNAMSILFGFAYRFEDLKTVVLKFVVDHLNKMYAGDKDPFEDYKEHPERSTLLADMLKLKFKNSA
ncbi:hypothetical protein BG003_005092 [Podila horticola]|nr:hypothetical protein BG003_005092 [Podila horticola]